MIYADVLSLHEKHQYTKSVILFISILQKQLLCLQAAVCAPVPTPSQASFWQTCLYALPRAEPPSPLSPSTQDSRSAALHMARLWFSRSRLWPRLFCTASRGHACYPLSLYEFQWRAYRNGKDTVVFPPSSTEPLILTNQVISVCKGKPVI